MIKKTLFLLFLPIVVFSQNGSQDENSLAQGVEYYEQYMPTSTCGEIIDYKYFSVSYCEETKTSEWSIYYYNKERREAPSFPRANVFQSDPQGRGADLSDYKYSGYDRGHLTPSRDMAFDETALKESFYMTNMSPQTMQLNRGPMRRLEYFIKTKLVDWTNRMKGVVIITGFTNESIGTIKKESVIPVPKYYYKVIIDVKVNRAIAFLLPNNANRSTDIMDYIVSFEDLQSMTGLDFFYKLDDSVENEMESLTTGYINNIKSNR